MQTTIILVMNIKLECNSHGYCFTCQHMFMNNGFQISVATQRRLAKSGEYRNGKGGGHCYTIGVICKHTF